MREYKKSRTIFCDFFFKGMLQIVDKNTLRCHCYSQQTLMLPLMKAQHNTSTTTKIIYKNESCKRPIINCSLSA